MFQYIIMFQIDQINDSLIGFKLHNQVTVAINKLESGKFDEVLML